MWYFSTARTSRSSTVTTPASLVSFSRIVLFADQSAHESFRENSSGDIAVLANCKSLSVFYANRCEGITGKFLSDRSFRGPVRSQIVPRKILGDIVVLQHCPNIKEFVGSGTRITGKFLSDRSFRGPSAHESFREKSQVTLWYFSTARTSRCSTLPTPALLVSFSRIVLFADQSAHESFREKS